MIWEFVDLLLWNLDNLALDIEDGKGAYDVGFLSLPAAGRDSRSWRKGKRAG
ncbi:hypothetical protein KAW50_07225 [candidate division WOR-3 bacterium]|nr:hypothetical protein [candidate division WOR-3 bacterium]